MTGSGDESASPEAWCALLEERGEAFGVVFGLEAARDEVDLGGDSLLQIEVEAERYGAFGEAERDAAAPRIARGELQRPRQQAVGRYTSLTRPICSASAADTMRPVRMMSLARATPTRRGRRCVPPQPGIRPSLISGCPAAPSAMIRGRRRPALLAPAADGGAVDGRDHRLGKVLDHPGRRRGQTARRRASSADIDRIWRMSAPAEKARPPAPVRTTARTLSSSPAFLKASRKLCSSSVLNALRASGRFNVKSAVAPSWRTNSGPLLEFLHAHLPRRL